jgi:ribonuclease HI
MKASPPDSGKLFVDPDDASPSAGVHIAEVDGASRGNPGPASYAVIIRAPNGDEVCRLGKYIGRTTNNVAEYYALITALDYAAGHGIRKLRVRSDSELLVRQMQGRYKVSSVDLRPLHERASKITRSLDFFAVEHVPRERNRDADALANEALDRTGSSAGATASERGAGTGMQPGTAAPRQTARRAAQASDVQVPQLIRARYRDGLLVLAEPLDLGENQEVEIQIWRK